MDSIYICIYAHFNFPNILLIQCFKKADFSRNCGAGFFHPMVVLALPFLIGSQEFMKF
jgi:hypothetical protein